MVSAPEATLQEGWTEQGLHRRGGGPVTLGIDVGGTKVLGVALGSDGAVLAERRVPTPDGGPAVLDAVAGLAEELDARLGAVVVGGVGVGMPGLIDHTGVLLSAPNLPGVVDLPVQAHLGRRLDGVRVTVDNDATCAVAGEWAMGAAMGCSQVLMVTLGTGIGAGIVSEGTVVRGANGFAGEVGHMVVDPHGPPCKCGQHGCWELFASGSALGRLARDVAHAGQAPALVERAGGDPEAVRGEHVVAAVTEGDEEAARVMARFAWWLALGLASLANVLDPEVIVVGGGLVVAGQVLFVPTRSHFAELVQGGARRPEIHIVPAALGERAGAIGAAVTAREAT